MDRNDDVNETNDEVLRTRVKQQHRPPLPNEVLESIYEEWVAHPHQRKRVPYKERAQVAAHRGWWFSGWRGIGEDMLPLDADITARLAEREDGR